MFRWLNLLLLFCLVYHSGTDPKSVSGKKGGNVTLTCEFEDKVLQIDLSSETENIPVCEEKNCSGRVFKEGSCDIIIKNLSFSDAGKYFLRLYNKNGQTVKPIRKYQLHIHDDISVKTGENLTLDVLWSNVYKVETNSSGEWTEVWTRGHKIQNDRLKKIDENLIIRSFIATDAGTYRVLDSNNKTLITVTVIESSTGLKEKLNITDDHRADDTEQHTLKNCFLKCKECLVVLVVLVLLVLALIITLVVVVKTCQCRPKNTEDKNKGKKESVEMDFLTQAKDATD